MTCSRSTSLILRSATFSGSRCTDLIGPGLLAMCAAVLGDGALHFGASSARADRSRNRMCHFDVVDARSDNRDRLTRKAGIREPIHARNPRSSELVGDGHPRRLLKNIRKRSSALDVDGERRLRQGEYEIRGRLLEPLADACERFVGHILCGRGGRAEDRDAHEERKTSHLIKTMMARVQPVGGRP